MVFSRAQEYQPSALFVATAILLFSVLIGCSGGGGKDIPGNTVAIGKDQAVSPTLIPQIVWVQGAPLVLYFDESDATINAAYAEGETWTTELIEASGDVTAASGLYLSAVTDADGTVHAAYRDGRVSNIRYLTGTIGAWSAEEPIAQGENRGNGLDIAVDLAGNPWIAYRNDTTQALEAVHFNEGSWAVESIDGEGNTGLWPAMDRDLGGRMVIAYQNASEGSVKLAQFQNVGQWDIQTVADNGSAVLGRWMALGLRAGNQDNLSQTFPRIAYLYEQGADITLNFALPDNEGGWETEVVDPGLFGGTDNCIAVANSGSVWLTYLDAVSLDLMLAKRINGRWQTSVLDSDGSVGYWSDCLLVKNALHLVYGKRSEGQSSLLYRKLDNVY